MRGRWIVVTGGSSGIGLQIARQLVKRGNHVTIVADDIQRLTVAERQLTAFQRGQVDAVQCDMARSEDIDALVERLRSGGRCPDVLINNAGFGTYRPFEAADIDEIERLLAVNLGGHLRLTKGLIGAMIERRSGAISFMTSIAGRLPITPNATYCAAKHGMLGFAEALRYEVRRFGIEVTAVCPGRVDTAFFDHPTFRERTRGPENKSSITVERAARATISAIARARFITYVPASLGIISWLYEALPLITRPLYSRMMGARIERLYADFTK